MADDAKRNKKNKPDLMKDMPDDEIERLQKTLADSDKKKS